MAIVQDYTSGTVSVSTSGTTVTGVGTLWKSAGIRAGDTFISGGNFAMVTADATSETSLAIEAWPGTDLAAGSPYRIRFQPDGSRYSAAARELVEKLAPRIVSTDYYAYPSPDHDGLLIGDATAAANIYQNTTHSFRSRDGTQKYLGIAANGVFIGATSDFSNAGLYLGRSGTAAWWGGGTMFRVYADISDTETVLHDNIMTVIGHTGGATDNGVTRAVARTGMAGMAESTGTTWLRASEHVVVIGEGQTGPQISKVLDVTLHSQVPGNGVDQLMGIRLSSDHTGWLPSGVRADTGFYVLGEDGWTHGFRYEDVDGSLLYDVDQYGGLFTKSLRVQQGVAGADPGWVANDVAVFENVAGSPTNVAVFSSADSFSQFLFSNPASRTAGVISYAHSTGFMSFRSGAVTALTLGPTIAAFGVPARLASYPVAALNALVGSVAGDMAFATDGRRAGEAAGAGTGVAVFYANGGWRAVDTGLAVAA